MVMQPFKSRLESALTIVPQLCGRHDIRDDGEGAKEVDRINAHGLDGEQGLPQGHAVQPRGVVHLGEDVRPDQSLCEGNSLVISVPTSLVRYASKQVGLYDVKLVVTAVLSRQPQHPVPSQTRFESMHRTV